MPNPSSPSSNIAALLDHAANLQTQSDGELARRIHHSREIEISACAMQKRLRRLSPDLAKIAEQSPNNNDGELPRRRYLTANANAHRCEQAYQLARGQRAQAHILLDVNGRLSR